MIDRDQHLLWEAYVAEKKKDKDHDGDGEVESPEDEYKGSKDKAIKKSMKEEGTDGSTSDLTEREKFKLAADAGKRGKGPLAEDDEDEDVQEEMDTLRFSAEGRVNPEQLVFDAVLGWMKADTEGLVTPEDYEGYSMSDAFDDAKDFIRQAMQDISFSEIKAHMNDTANLGDPDEAAFEASVDTDIRRDDSRLSDMPPRSPGV